MKRPRTNKAAKLRRPGHIAFAVNEAWSRDFVADARFDGRKLHMLTVVDCYTRECLATDVGQSLEGEDVVNTLNKICTERGMPSASKTGNRSEFSSRAMGQWAYERRVERDFSRPGRHADNARVESVDGRLGRECLDVQWLLSMDDACDRIAARRADYNERRPHSALDWATPAAFARSCRLEPAIAIPRRRKCPLPNGTESGYRVRTSLR